ncbi:ferredoxin reductase [Pseudonocardia spinosispora]|uniref:ferredoxin reductase n=1 Tax=Pseudonocardia spinosispora TaxID=103441 RepID=UPI000491AE5A|nr:ferredoxin reductase [Pseudonocardia spinosispora]
MTEVGMRPEVSPLRRRLLSGVRLLFTPLLPDDYVELIDPLWSTRELRGRVERIEPQADDAVTVHVRPGFDWVGHRPGQYVRFGVVVDGVHHWRAYSLTSDPHASDGLISITPKLVDSGVVSPYLVRTLRVGSVVRLGEVEGTFTLPERPAGPVLFLTAGSGITPVMSMLRHLRTEHAMDDVVHIHSARTRDQVIFGGDLDELALTEDGLSVHVWESAEQGRVTPEDIARLCPDWRDRDTYASGPGELLDALTTHWEEHGDPERLHLERFQPVVGGENAGGEGGTIRFPRRNVEADCPPGTPMLVAGEEAGVDMPFGCRMGVCHTCVARLREGTVRDLRTGEVRQARNEMIRTCIHAPEGPVELDL